MFFSLTVFATAFALTAHGQLLVPTLQGPVLGTLVSPAVRQFLGIPYAIAKRWEAPMRPSLRSATLSATKFSDSCPQALNPTAVEFLLLTGLDNSTIFVPESENCLTVNIWAPSLPRKQKTAVLLWVYGGAFQFGTSNIPTYNGQNIVHDNDDILVVTFNYRLNIFGSPNAPQLVADKTKAQNFGLLDIDAAVQWVHDNIAAFGGDPERITLFGQSAGGAAIDAYTFAHPQDTKVKGVIEQSGNLGIVVSAATALDPGSWIAVANAVGCGNDNQVTDSAQLVCMKTVPSKQLEDAVINTNANFGPIPDGITIFSDTPARAAAGNFLHVPLLGGSTKQEGDIFVVDVQEVAAGIVVPNLTELLADLQTQIAFTCPAGKTAQDRISANVPTWRYEYQGMRAALFRFGVNSETQNPAVFPDISTRPDLRAYHASEIPLIFGTAPSPGTTEKALSKFIQGAWVAFARDPAQGLINVGWPKYSPTTSTLAQIGGFFNETGITFSQGQLLDFTCNSIPTLAAVTAQLTALLGPGAGGGLF
ncbi:hypothetical protein DXG01_001711 [Tephrocybe rancida]|nr:hypothetical protein DXG01_001711 [Tephrocybe rancida]